MLTDEAALDLPGAFARFEARLKEQISDPGRQSSVCSAVFILMGLRYDEQLLNRLFGEVTKMRESSTYQAILREGRTEGRTEGLRFAILMTGEQRFGAIMPTQQATLEAIADFDRLTRIHRRLLAGASWDDALSTT